MCTYIFFNRTKWYKVTYQGRMYLQTVKEATVYCGWKWLQCLWRHSVRGRWQGGDLFCLLQMSPDSTFIMFVHSHRPRGCWPTPECLLYSGVATVPRNGAHLRLSQRADSAHNRTPVDNDSEAWPSAPEADLVSTTTDRRWLIQLALHQSRPRGLAFLEQTLLKCGRPLGEKTSLR